MNKVILMGRLTRDPDVRVSTGERSMSIARYTLAVDRRGRRSDNGEQTADFISCVAFDRAAEFAEKYLHQGTKVVVTGRSLQRVRLQALTTEALHRATDQCLPQQHRRMDL